MSNPKQSHFIRIELPPGATEEEIEALQLGVVALVDTYSERYDYDIDVSGGAWYPPETDERTEPIPVALRKLHSLVQHHDIHNSPTDMTEFRNALQALADLGMSAVDLQIHLACAQTANDLIRRNMVVENNLTTALDMVLGYVGNPDFRIKFQAGKA